jgi:hypothetical protein
MTGVSLSRDVKCEVERDLLLLYIGSGDGGSVFCWLEARGAILGPNTARLRGLSPRSLLTSRGKAESGPGMGPRDADLRFLAGLETGEDVGGEESGDEVFDLDTCGGLEEGGEYLFGGLRTTRVVTTVVEVDARDDCPGVLEKKLTSGVAQSMGVGGEEGGGDDMRRHEANDLDTRRVAVLSLSFCLCSRFGLSPAQ